MTTQWKFHLMRSEKVDAFHDRLLEYVVGNQMKVNTKSHVGALWYEIVRHLLERGVSTTCTGDVWGGYELRACVDDSEWQLIRLRLF